jgi:granule-bound starch synthase
MQLQMQQQLASRQAAKGTKMMATPLAASSRPVMVRAPAQNAMGAGLKHVAGAGQTAEQRNVVVKALGNGVSAPGPATPLNIVFVSAEVSPWSKTGGLGDVVGGLPVELAKRGHKVITIAPRYDQYSDCWDTSVVVNVDGESVRFFHAIKNGVHRVFIDHPWFLARVWGKTGSKLYGARSGADYVDNHKRFTLFCKAAIESVKVLPFGPGEDCVFVANDWHSGLVPLLIKDVYQPRGQFKNAKVAFCIHNIAFQGRFWPESFKDMALPPSAMAKLGFKDGYNKVFDEKNPLDDDEKPSESMTGGLKEKLNWMKAGILSADKVLTVSPNYASEISANAEKGVELDKYIREVGGAEGIVNGMDVTEWNPKTDKLLPVKYDRTTVFEGKAAAKAALQAEMGLPVDPTAPLFGYIGRLEEQKGVDILLAALPKLAGSNAQVAILGTGKAKYEAMVKAMGKKNPKFKGVVKFSAPLAHQITAGADFILVPSRFEPCGLIQLHAMQYGTVPVVSSTGGLVDTVKEGITGFHMGAFDPDKLNQADADAIAATVQRASQAYTSGKFREMVKACINQDLSWSQPAKKWEAVLEEVYKGCTAAPAKKASVATPVQAKQAAMSR